MAMLPWWIYYPYVNNEIQNLDWLLQISNENTDMIKNFIGINTIKYADPILWDITSQYEANTIVVDPQTGDAYISTKAVPYGVALSNDGYWTRIYNYASELHVLRQQIAADEQLSTTATAPRSVDDLVFLNGLLYRVTASMIAGDSYVEGSNCVKTTINAELIRLHTSISNEVQARTDADTALGGRIDDEVQARTDADTALGRRIDDEVQARTDADTALGRRIDDEAEARADADTALGTRIDDIHASLYDATPSVFNKRFNSILLGSNNFLIGTDYTKNSIISVTNVLDYGADPTGATDSTQAFIEAFNALPNSNPYTPGGNGLYIPTGTYIISSELDFTSKSCEIYGDGVNSTRIIGWGGIDSDTNHLTYLKINNSNVHDIWFAGNEKNCVGVRVVTTEDNVQNRIYNCMFYDMLIGIQTSGSTIAIHNNIFTNISVGIDIGTGVNIIVDNCFIALFTQGLTTASTEGLKITNNYFIGGSNSNGAIVINGTSLDCNIDNNMIDQIWGLGGIIINQPARFLHISKSWFGSNAEGLDAQNAIRFNSNAYYCSIKDCDFVDIKNYDIYFGAAGHDVVIDNCYDFYDDNSLVNHGPINGSSVVFAQAFTRIRIVNCDFTPQSAGQYGVVVTTGSTGYIDKCYATQQGNVLTEINALT